MAKKLANYLFRTPEEIGLDNFMVLVVSAIIAIVGFLGTVINIFLDLGLMVTLTTLVPIVVMAPFYLLNRFVWNFTYSKYILLIF